MSTTIIPVEAGSKITPDYGYTAVNIETSGTSYRLDFPQTGEDLVLACDTLIEAVQRVREMAPSSVR